MSEQVDTFPQQSTSCQLHRPFSKCQPLLLPPGQLPHASPLAHSELIYLCFGEGGKGGTFPTKCLGFGTSTSRTFGRATKEMFFRGRREITCLSILWEREKNRKPKHHIFPFISLFESIIILKDGWAVLNWHFPCWQHVIQNLLCQPPALKIRKLYCGSARYKLWPNYGCHC